MEYNKEHYKGYKEIITDDESYWAGLYSDSKTNPADLLLNQYLFVKSNSDT